jgi:cytoskeleton protein RodZ
MSVGHSMSEAEHSNGTAAEVPQSAAPQPVLTLRQARERAGLHMVALAATLKVPAHRLEALEAGRYEDLPDITFARALALSVCRVLKVDAAPILASLPASSVVRLGEPEHALNAPMPSRSAPAIGPAAGSSGQSVPWPLAFALLVLVVAVVLWFLLPASPRNASVQVSQGTAASEAATTNSPLEPASVSEGASSAATVATPLESMPPASTVTALGPASPVVGGVQAPVIDASAAPAPPLPSDGLLQVRVLDTAWVQVTGASGRVWVQRELKSGEAVGFSSDLPLSVVLGRADVARVNVRGQEMDLVPHTRSNVARFEVR